MATTSAATFSSQVSSAEFRIHVQDPMEHLHHCRQLIEDSLITVKNAVIGLGLTTPVLRTEAAAALDYELALLQLLSNLHIQDVEQSLFPRLRKSVSGTSTPLQALIPTLESQHRDHQAVFGRIAECLHNFPTTEDAAAEQRLALLTDLAEQLEAMFRSHISLEDEQLLPACRGALTQEDLAGMQQEMRLRYKSH
jgi:iron-sulfur cluster repair protein YtfE (RIC family)